MPVLGSQLVALVESELGASAHTRDLKASEVADGETRRRKGVETAAEGGLAHTPVLVKQQRVQINPTAVRGDQLDSVRPPVCLQYVAELSEDVEHLGLLS